uniref:Uncharacterized protein n=1 Tax=Plectus sambesii TaxID=2011161 RepID=A0A914WB76_9BILA
MAWINGTIVESFAQVVAIRPDGECEQPLEATLFDLKESSSVSESLFDLSRLFPMGGRVRCLMNDCGNAQFSFTSRLVQRNYAGPKVVKVEPIDEPADATLARECHISQAYGTIIWANDIGEGEVNVANHGKVKFLQYATMPDSECKPRYELMRLTELMPAHRSVLVRLYMGGPVNADVIIASVEPMGKLYTGEGVITEVKERCAVIMSYSFGEIFMPLSSFRCREWTRDADERDRVLSHLVGLKVRFTISHSIPTKPTKWRAIRVESLL